MKNFYYLYNGRSALNYVLNNYLLKRDEVILYPDFSCDVLFQNNDLENFKYDFYEIKKDFKISLDLIKKKITKKTKIILVINFFGIKQNLKQLYKFCKRNKILLILDDCHTFYNIKKSNKNDCDIKFFSPSKVFDEIDIGGILQINNNSVEIVKKLQKSYFYNDLIFNFKRIIKIILIYENLKFLKKRPKYEDKDFFKSKINVNNLSLRQKNIKKIDQIDIKKENKKRINNFKFWIAICNKLKIKPLLNIKDIKHGCPLYFPALCENRNKSRFVFDFGWKHKIDIISWPTLHSSQKKNIKIIKYWEKLVYFPMNKNFYLRKKLLNDK